MPVGRTADLVRDFLRPRVAEIFANSRYTAEHFSNGAPRPPVRVVYNAVDLGRFDPATIDRTRAREALGLAPDVHALGVVSQITPWKAQDDAIRILASVRSAGLNARLLVVGDAKFTVGSIRYDNEVFESSLRELVRELGVEEHVDFLGDRRDVPEILSALDLVLVPSWEEPFGRIVIESMAMETPVIATNVGGPGEILDPQEAGLLLPPQSPDAGVARPRPCSAIPSGSRPWVRLAGTLLPGDSLAKRTWTMSWPATRRSSRRQGTVSRRW